MQMFEKTAQKTRFQSPFEKIDKNRFFWRVLPTKLVHIGAKGASRKF